MRFLRPSGAALGTALDAHAAVEYPNGPPEDRPVRDGRTFPGRRSFLSFGTNDTLPYRHRTGIHHDLKIYPATRLANLRSLPARRIALASGERGYLSGRSGRRKANPRGSSVKPGMLP